MVALTINETDSFTGGMRVGKNWEDYKTWVNLRAGYALRITSQIALGNWRYGLIALQFDINHAQ